jgi:hypothetical protein
MCILFLSSLVLRRIVVDVPNLECSLGLFCRSFSDDSTDFFGEENVKWTLRRGSSGAADSALRSCNYLYLRMNWVEICVSPLARKARLLDYS